MEANESLPPKARGHKLAYPKHYHVRDNVACICKRSEFRNIKVACFLKRGVIFVCVSVCVYEIESEKEKKCECVCEREMDDVSVFYLLLSDDQSLPICESKSPR